MTNPESTTGRQITAKEIAHFAQGIVTNRLNNLISPVREYLSKTFEQQDADSGNLSNASGLSRRSFLGLTVTTLVAAGCGNTRVESSTPTTFPTPTEKSSSTPKPTPTSVSTPLPTKEPTPTPENLTFERYGDIEIAIDADGIPVRYKLPDGKIVQLDKDKLRRVKEKVIREREPEIAEVITIETNSGVSQASHSKEHPRVEQLPRDVLSEAELKRYGIEIIQTDNTKLYIRQEAFSPGHILFEYRNQHSPDRTKQLTIVLVDGPFLAAEFLQDQRYESVRSFLGYAARNNKFLEEYRQNYINNKQSDIITQRLHLPEARRLKNDRDIKFYENSLLSLKSDILFMRNLDHNSLLFRYFSEVSGFLGSFSDKRKSTGLYVPRKSTKEDDSTNKAIAFISVGKDPSKSSLVIAFGSDGKHRVISDIRIPHQDLQPSTSQTHPNPDNFKRTIGALPENPRSYPFEVYSAGHTLRHELKHGNLEDENDLNRKPSDEYLVDTEAVDTIRKAWRRWMDSNFRDNTGYDFVFTAKEGGYILTEATKSGLKDSDSI